MSETSPSGSPAPMDDIDAVKRRLQIGVEASKLVIWEWDLPSDRVSLSGRWQDIVENPDEATVVDGSFYASVMDPAYVERYQAWVRQMLKGPDQPDPIRVRGFSRKGREFWVEITATVSSRDASGQAIEMVGTMADVSEQHRTQLALARSEQRYRKVLESINDTIFQLDDNGQITFLNPAWEQITGHRINSALAQPITRFVPDEEQANLTQRLGELLSGKVDVIQETVTIVTASGRQRWCDLVARGLTDENGESQGVVGTISDLTELLEAQRQLILSKNAAELASQAKGEFLANMSHEIRTPLNGLLGMTRLVLDSELTGEQREHLNIAMSSGEALAEIINDILDFSKIEAGRLEIEAVPFAASDLIVSVAKPHELLATAKSLRYRVDIDPRLPHVLIGDPLRIRQVLNNLLSNAVKFTTRGQVKLQARLVRMIDAERAEILLAVTDTGVGIAADEQHRVFEPFQQADASISRRFGGTGLGLSIVHRLVQLMDGQMRLHSTCGQGSRFEIVLPLRISHAAAPAPVAQLPQLNLAGLRVLLAEDNIVNQKLVTTVLNRAGATVIAACNGREAVEFWRREPFDLVLMDVQMPVMDGMQAVKRIRDLEQQLETGIDTSERSLRHTPVIALTAHALSGDRELCLTQGMDGYVSKPLNPEQLAAEVLRVLPARHSADGAHARLVNTALSGLKTTATVTNPAVELIDVTKAPTPQAQTITKPLNSPLTRSPQSHNTTHQQEASVAMTDSKHVQIYDQQQALDRLGGDQELLVTIAQLLIDDVPGNLATLSEQLDQGDAIGASKTAHSIKGAVANFCAPLATQLARDMEMSGKAGELETARSLFIPLQTSLHELLNALQQDLLSGATAD